METFEKRDNEHNIAKMVYFCRKDVIYITPQTVEK